MDDLSNGEAIEWDRGNPARRCTAHKKTGERCRRWAILGGTVCPHHGGAAEHVRNAARTRLANAADRMAKQLLGMAQGAESEAVKLAAIRDALDRAGLGAKTAVELSVGVQQPWEQIVGMAPMTRAESRAARGVPDDPPQRALEPVRPAERDIVDAEVVADPGVHRPPWAEGGSAGSSPHNGPPDPADAWTTMDEAQDQIAAQTREVNLRTVRRR